MTKSGEQSMQDLTLIKSLIGDTVTADDLRYVDCYVHHHLGLFIPSVGACQYAIRPKHIHPSYMFIIVFSELLLKSNQK